MRRVLSRARVSLVCAAVVGAALAVSPSGGAGATPTATLTVAPDADATVMEASPTKNLGTATTLQVDASPAVESYLRFTVSGLVGAVTGARLRLWVVNPSADGPTLYPTGAAWTEKAITWATKPARTGPAAGDAGAVKAKTWVEYDVSALVGGDGAYGFALAGPSRDGTDFSSREKSDHRPQLVITTDSNPPPPTTTTTTATTGTSTTRTTTTTAPPPPPPPAGTIRDALLAPATGAWFGFYAHTDVYNQAAEQAAVTTLEDALGRRADIDHWYEPWGDTFPGWRQPWDIANGRIPMISWGKQASDVVLSGADDAYIAARADGIKALGKPVFLRWFWEMDGNRNLAISQSPAAYIAAWRHIHDIFTARGATNVAWVWCPNASAFNAGDAQRYYPGDDVVDWICADGYNFYPDSNYREFAPIFAGFYAWASQRPKPLMIGEYGDQQAAPGQRAAWIDAAHAVLEEQYPRILAVVYFHSDSGHNWTFWAEPDALDAFRRMAQDPYFLHSQLQLVATAVSLG